MLADEKIENSDELEFAIFCIENVAAKLFDDLKVCFRTEKALSLLCFEGNEMI